MKWSRLPGPAKVLAAARRRLEAGHGIGSSPFRVSLADDERDEVGKLLGVTWVLSGRAVGAKNLCDAIESLGCDLETLLTAIGGPLRDRPAERATALRESERERSLAFTELASAGVPAEMATAWMLRRGMPRAGSGRLLDLARQCATVWREMPSSQGSTMLLTVLAAAALNDPHALDRGSPVAAGVLRLLNTEVPDSAQAWRQAWEDRGIVCDPVSSRVLTLNLPLHGDAAACRLTDAAGSEPLWLTWRSLLGQFRSPATAVYVCENPSILVAAADQLGSRSRPLICTNGHPSAATRQLLTTLASTGTTLHIRADDDDAGQEIVSGLRGAIPNTLLWRYVQRPPVEPRYEEQDLALLLSDLAS